MAYNDHGFSFYSHKPEPSMKKGAMEAIIHMYVYGGGAVIRPKPPKVIQNLVIIIIKKIMDCAIFFKIREHNLVNLR